MPILDKPVSLENLRVTAQDFFGTLVKAVVDVDEEIMAINAELHADLEYELLERGSRQENLWGINIYPDKFPAVEWIEFDSMINIRPGHGNYNRYVNDPALRKKIIDIVSKMVLT